MIVPVQPFCIVANYPCEYQLSTPVNLNVRQMFRNSQEFVQSLLTKFKSEHGVYFIPSSTFSGDPYG